MTDPCALQELAVRRVPTQVRSRQRYDEICEAALQLLRSGGVAACTMAAVAAEAQLKPTSLYRYFPNIESLLYAVVSMQLDEVHEWLQGHMAASTSLADAERLASEALERYERRFRAEPAMMAIWAGTLAMPSLVQLNVADTRRNARVLADAANAVRRTPLPYSKVLMNTHVIRATVPLMQLVGEDEAAEIRHELCSLVLEMFRED
ncbi:MAG: TetR/AcrR family transcriptional regulator [Ilumatobacteraceae bacterium]